MFIELLMENKGKNVDNYLFKLKLTASKTRLKMLRHAALIMICTGVCHEIEVVRFLGLFHLCLFLNYVNQTTKSNLSKNLLTNSEYVISK